jgi:hypothetical protein
MQKALLTLLLFFSFCFNYAQDKNTDIKAASIPEANCASVDALASYIKQNFTTDSARIRAIYVWITNHISYDVQRLKDMEKNPDMPVQTVANVLATRTTVCQGYSDLFVALCRGAGINAAMVCGYTKNQGKVDPISHAWAAAELGGEWYLFDPTWGAGYVKDDRFVRAFNNSFYKVPPAKLILDHMPFDPMYQFLSYPITNKEFINGTTPASQVVFNYRDSVKQYVQLSSLQQMATELRRLEAAGIQNDLLLRRQTYLKKSLQSFNSRDAFEEGNKAFTGAADLFKEYIGHKNKQFSGIGDNDLRQLVDNIEQNIKLSRSLFLQAVPKTDAQRQARSGNIASADRFWTDLNKEKQFVQQYLATDVAARKQLFMRR